MKKYSLIILSLDFLAAYSAENFYYPDVTVVVMNFPVEKV